MAGIYGTKKPPPKAPSFQLGWKPIYSTTVKKPNLAKPYSAQPYATPASRDYGQQFLYPQGYAGVKKPVNMGTFFTGGAGAATGQTNRAPTDYGALIAGDWEVQDAEAAMAAMMGRKRGDFQAGLRQHLIDLGLSDTAALGGLGQYIDADTIQKAVENKYSATAQISQQAERSRAQNNAALAARGILSSGQTTKSQTDVSAAAESGRYSALREFLQGGQAGLTDLADTEYGLARGVAQARAAAAQRAAEMAWWQSQAGGEEGYGEDYAALGTDYRRFLGPVGTGTVYGTPTKPKKPKAPIYMGGAYRY